MIPENLIEKILPIVDEITLATLKKQQIQTKELSSTHLSQIRMLDEVIENTSNTLMQILIQARMPHVQEFISKITTPTKP